MQGTCVAGKVKDCGDSDACTLDSCDSKGKCVNTITTGLSCDDGNPCTSTDLCDETGACKGTNLKCDDGNPCTEDSCNPTIGCNTTAVPDGASCDDGDLCTVDGTCLNAQCAPGKAIACQSNQVCVQSLCDGSTGKCVASQAKVGTLCDDGDPCSLGDNCNSIGDCVAKTTGCNDGNPCTQDACSTQGCTYQKLTGPCDDNDACTLNESCQELNGVASCQSVSIKDCDDKNPCTQDTCEPAKGCVTTALKDGQSCDDGDKCTADDTCQAGQCTGGKDTCSCTQDSDCDDKNPCTKDTCGNDSKCSAIAVQDGSNCDDGDPCTAGGTCKSAGAQSTCEKGSAKSCDDQNPCTTDSCDAKTGCLNKAKVDGDGCDDGDSCTENDGCTAGKCVGATKKSEVTTLAGKGQGFKNDKGTSAQFNVPSGLVRDSAGNLFVADTTNHQIRKIDSSGNVTTFAGGPLAGQINGTGQSASFNGPRGLSIDDQDNLYVADTGNHLVRKITPAGVVTTVAGSNSPGGFGQPLQGGFAEGKGTAAKFNGLSAIAWSAGTLYVADTANHRIRKVTPDGTVSTLAGSATEGKSDGKGAAAQLNLPEGVTVSSAGVVYVGDTGNHRIRVIQTDGSVSTLAGSSSGQKDGQGVAAQFKEPMGLTFDGIGQLLVCDSGNHMIRTVKTSGEVGTYVGTVTSGFTDGALESTQFNQPSAIFSDAKGKAWVADRGNHRIREINDAAKTCAIGANSP
ncbi:MAG TPA: hypothetical protein DCQ06_04645 [Myxococcales bacterium]|nr:hypothetical protein [Myxococcales bacterium]